MMRNLKTLGLALIAVFALSATAASAASAKNAVWKGGSAVHGTDTVGGGPVALTGTNNVSCNKATYTGTVGNKTPTLDLTPVFEECLAATLPATVTHNGCVYRLHLGTKTLHTAPVTMDLVCPAGKQIERHFYSDAGHTTSVCTIEIPEQLGLTGLTAHEETNPPGVAVGVRVTGSVAGITNYRSGACTTPNAENSHDTREEPKATLHVDLTLTGSPGPLSFG